MSARTVVVLFGPKGVGKSTVATVLNRRLGVHHVDADPLVVELVEQGVQPHPTYGWLEPVKAAVDEALEDHPVVAVEATGAWPTDWEIVHRLRREGVRVRSVRLMAQKETSKVRALARTDRRLPITEADLDWIYDRSSANCSRYEFDAQIDTDAPLDEDAVIRMFEDILPAPSR